MSQLLINSSDELVDVVSDMVYYTVGSGQNGLGFVDEEICIYKPAEEERGPSGMQDALVICNYADESDTDGPSPLELLIECMTFSTPDEVLEDIPIEHRDEFIQREADEFEVSKTRLLLTLGSLQTRIDWITKKDRIEAIRTGYRLRYCSNVFNLPITSAVPPEHHFDFNGIAPLVREQFVNHVINAATIDRKWLLICGRLYWITFLFNMWYAAQCTYWGKRWNEGLHDYYPMEHAIEWTIKLIEDGIMGTLCSADIWVKTKLNRTTRRRLKRFISYCAQWILPRDNFSLAN